MKWRLTATLLSYCVIACTNTKRLVQVQYTGYEIRMPYRTDTVMQQFLQAYTDSLYQAGHIVVGFATSNMYKKQPESALGNFMADGMRIMAEKKLGVPVHAAFINYGGIRSGLRKGDITIDDLCALMPFNNVVVVQKLKGNVVRALLDHIAGSNGWPCSGITMKIKNKQATDVYINGRPLDENEWYYIANTDYIANGGDHCTMLRTQAQVNKNYLLSDALADYVRMLTQQGKPVAATIENRITYAL